MYRSILVATDGSEYSARAVKQAALLAKMSGAKLLLFHAAPNTRMPGYVEGAGTELVREVNEIANNNRDAEAKGVLSDAHTALGFPDISIEELFVVNDSPYQAILETARYRDCDLIVMAPHGHHGIAGILLGSETQKVLTHSKVPVLVVH